MIHPAKQVRTAVIIVVVLAALLMIFVVPFIAFDLVKPIKRRLFSALKSLLGRPRATISSGSFSLPPKRGQFA